MFERVYGPRRRPVTIVPGSTLISLGGEGSFIWYFAALTGIALLVFAAAFIVDCQVEPARKRKGQPA